MAAFFSVIPRIPRVEFGEAVNTLCDETGVGLDSWMIMYSGPETTGRGVIAGKHACTLRKRFTVQRFYRRKI